MLSLDGLPNGLPLVTAAFLLKHFLLTLVCKFVDAFWDLSDFWDFFDL